MKQSNENITYINGKTIMPNVAVICYLLLGIILAAILGSSGLEGLFALIFLPIGLIPFFFQWGTELDIKSETYRNFKALYGLRWGVWKTYKPYSDIVIQTNNYSGLAQSRTNVSTSIQDRKTEIFFMTSDHRHKIHIAVVMDVKEVGRIAQSLALQTGLSIRKFSPKKMTAVRRR